MVRYYRTMRIQAPNQPRVPVTPPRKWTVLVWSACDNDLYECCVRDLDKCERGLGPGIQVLAQVDHRQNPDPAGPHTVQRLELQPDQEVGLHSPVVADLGDSSMASPRNLSDFVQWGIKNYPAENYWLVISDHGDAWKGATEDEGHREWMSLPQIESALHEARDRTGQKLDLLSFDCCYMGSSEVVHQLQHESRYMVGSQEAMGFVGLPYDSLLGEVAALEPRQLAQHLVAVSGADPEDIPTFAAFDLEKVPALSQSVGKLGRAVTESSLSGEQLRKAVDATQSFWDYRDVYDLAAQLAAQPGTEAGLAEAALQVQQAVSEVVIAERHADTHPQAHGLQIEVNPDSEAERQLCYGEGAVLRDDSRPWKTSQGSYAETAFARATQWPRVIDKIHS